MPRGETSIDNGLEHIVATETVLSDVDGGAGRLILRGHLLEEIAGKHGLEWLAGLLWQDLVHRPLDEPTLRRDLGTARVQAFAHVRALLPAARALTPLAAARLFVA